VNMEDYFYLLIGQNLRQAEYDVSFPPLPSAAAAPSAPAPKKGNAGPEAIFPTLNSMGVFRVDCDPYDVSTFVAPFNTWAGTQKVMPLADVKAIIKWGLTGLDLDHPPANNILLWETYLAPAANDVLATAIKTANDKNFIRLNGKVIHPYLLEVGTDLLKDTKEKSLFSKGKGTVPDTLAAAAAEVLKAPTDDTKLDAFMAEWATFFWTTRKSLPNTVPAIVLAHGQTEQTHVPIWVRSKWSTYAVEKTNFEKAPVLELFQSNGKGVDRTFYKASNFVGLKSLNELLFANKKVPFDFVIRQVGCKGYETNKANVCTGTDTLKEMLGHTDAVKGIYDAGTCAASKVAAAAALADFCDDAKAKMNKF